MTSWPKSAIPTESSSTMTPSPPTVDHLPSSGVQNTIGPILFSPPIDLAALIGAISEEPPSVIILSHMVTNLELNSILLVIFLLLLNSSLNSIFNLSKKLCWIDPITLANLSISVGFYSTQSENKIEICSVSMDLWANRFFFVLSIELVKHFLKMN